MRFTRERKRAELDAMAKLMRARYGGDGIITPDLVLAATGERTGTGWWQHMGARRYRSTVAEIQPWEEAA